MKNFIPTYEQALEMVNSKGELVFYETKHIVDGFNVSVFNYRLAQYNDFINPVDGKDYDAKELRGISYVFNADGTLYNHYLMLKKFWNINQVSETQLNILKEYKIKYVYNKEDGSLISFIKLPNGKIVAKTKAGFDNEQAIQANQFLQNDYFLYTFVSNRLNENLVTFFEFVSFKNKIVLNYIKTELILLKVRNNNTGEYVDVETYRGTGGIVTVSTENYTSLDELMSLSETLKNKEGWVITFIDSNGDEYLAKQKTNWYWELHNLLTEKLNRENDIIVLILNETIDDVVAQLDKENDKERIEWIENISNVLKEYIDKKSKDVLNLYSKYDGNMKDFAIKYHKDEDFGLFTQIIKGKNIYDVVKEFILKNTYRLEQARDFIRTKDI